jgi:IS1 family transposase
MTTPPTKNRVPFDLPPRSMERLNALKRKTEASSYAEVVKDALRLYEALIEDTDAGKQVLVRNAAGVVSPYRLFL